MRAVVSLSGGQDSATVLFHALAHYDEVAAVSFDYGQRHRVELECAKKVAELAVVPHSILNVPTLSDLGDGSLTNPNIPSAADATGTGNDYAAERGLPSSFVPGRNLILLGLAAAYGLPRGFDTLVTGVCAEDRAGYPDCRVEFVMALEHAIQVGMDAPGFVLDAPLLHRTKAETWALANALGPDVLAIVRDETHTCYEGDHESRHLWGYGCGSCPACEVRAEGWAEFVATREVTA